MRFSSFALLGLGLVGLAGYQVACGSQTTTNPGGPGGSTSDTATNSTGGGSSTTGGQSSSGGGTGNSTTSGTGNSSGSTGATGSSTGNTSGATSSTGSSGTSTGDGGSGGPQHWVGTWTASPYFDSGNQPPASLANAVLRQVTHVSIGGSTIRVQFSNLSGNGPVTINAAHIALCKASPAVDSTIDTTTDKALAFSGKANVTIAQGQEVWSDSIAFTVPALGNITITTAFGSVPSQVVGHSGSRTTSYLQPGSTTVTAANMTSAPQTFQHWYYISGIDVMADANAKGVVAIGDSITDGRGTDNDKNNRWTDIMSADMRQNAATANVAVMNQGIGATNLVGTSGTAAQARFKRDVLGQSGVHYAIVLDGVNDIAGGASFASMKSAYDDLISRARAQGVLIYGATILPFGASSDYSVANESVRQQVNTYIKSGAFDGVVDFDAALTDGGNPPKMQAVYAMWAQMDGLHPGPAGYQKMGDSVPLTLFTK
jgi:lysophospholipase L1-like esterase